MTVDELRQRIGGAEMKVRGHRVHLRIGVYGDGTPALVYECDNGEPWAKLTVCMPGLVTLGEDEILVKTWEENADTAKAALASGLFEDTGRRVPAGYVEAQVWRVRALEKDAYGYPIGWPKCPGCGLPALDGHITCGQVQCDEGGRR